MSKMRLHKRSVLAGGRVGAAVSSRVEVADNQQVDQGPVLIVGSRVVAGTWFAIGGKRRNGERVRSRAGCLLDTEDQCGGDEDALKRSEPRMGDWAYKSRVKSPGPVKVFPCRTAVVPAGTCKVTRWAFTETTMFP
jgi:hypothetical protein